ncbi:MAG: competence/damage-inducible protein A [Thermoplasmatota archaeon]
MKRLGLLVIGDEILAGHTQDTNTHWLAQQLKPMGILLARVEVCTDELGDLQSSMRRFLFDLDVDYVITSGGLGPTPDDRTMEALAAVLGVPLELRPEHEAWMHARAKAGYERGRYDSPEPGPGVLKMAKLPAGTEPMPNGAGTALGCIAHHNGRQLFTLPGVPKEFQRMFLEAIAPRLETATPLHTEELVLYSYESRFYEALCELEAAFPSVTLGSYPMEGYMVVRATGPQQDAAALIERMREIGAAFLQKP